MDFRCIVVGEGGDREALEGLIRDASLTDRVRLVGALPQEEVRALYRKAWIFALPCVESPGGNKDGLPNVLMEAMASGVPVVTTPNSAQAELITDGIHGLLIPPHSPVRLADSMMRLCAGGPLREGIVRAARQRIMDDFDNRKTIEPLVHLLRQFVFTTNGGPSRGREAGNP
jgi:glycosyltransferase involved in cell wall biosynthesis